MRDSVSERAANVLRTSLAPLRANQAVPGVCFILFCFSPSCQPPSTKHFHNFSHCVYWKCIAHNMILHASFLSLVFVEGRSVLDLWMCLFMGASHESSSASTSGCFSESPIVWGDLKIEIGTGACDLECSSVECFPRHAWSPGFGPQHHITICNISIQHPPLHSELFTWMLRSEPGSPCCQHFTHSSTGRLGICSGPTAWAHGRGWKPLARTSFP